MTKEAPSIEELAGGLGETPGEPLPERARGSNTSYASYQDLKRRKPFRWYHERIIDDMLAHPGSTLVQRAERLGYKSPAYLSVIMNSDMFKAAYKARRREYTENLDESIVQKTSEAAERALDIILSKFEKKGDNIPFKDVSDFTHKTLAALGYGAQSGGAGGVVVDNRTMVVGSVSKEQLERSRAKIRVVEQTHASAGAPDSKLNEIEQVRGKLGVSVPFLEHDRSVEPEPSFAEDSETEVVDAPRLDPADSR